jgi:membrane-associated HD superfamily phosphohydrolase
MHASIFFHIPHGSVCKWGSNPSKSRLTIMTIVYIYSVHIYNGQNGTYTNNYWTLVLVMITMVRMTLMVKCFRLRFSVSDIILTLYNYTVLGLFLRFFLLLSLFLCTACLVFCCVFSPQTRWSIPREAFDVLVVLPLVSIIYGNDLIDQKNVVNLDI